MPLGNPNRYIVGEIEVNNRWLVQIALEAYQGDTRIDIRHAYLKGGRWHLTRRGAMIPAAFAEELLALVGEASVCIRTADRVKAMRKRNTIDPRPHFEECGDPPEG